MAETSIPSEEVPVDNGCINGCSAPFGVRCSVCNTEKRQPSMILCQCANHHRWFGWPNVVNVCLTCSGAAVNEYVMPVRRSGNVGGHPRHAVRVWAADVPADGDSPHGEVRVVPQDVADGDGPMKDAVDLLNDQIEYLKSLLADLLTDCENWGCAPNERYAEALR